MRTTQRRALILGATVILWAFDLAGAVGGDGIAWETLIWEDEVRLFGVYVPEGIEEPMPLVVLFHGGGGSAAQTWGLEHGRSWRALAERDGFVLLLPEGRNDPSTPENHHWNDCRASVEEEDVVTAADDVGFILHILDLVSEVAEIDPERVFVTGASNGGMMTYRLAMEAGDRFAAAAAVMANLPHPSTCAHRANPIPMLIMNGTEDPLMPHEGGCVAGSRCARGRVLSTDETVSFWVDVNGAERESTVEARPNRSLFDGSRVWVYTYPGGSMGEDVVYVRVEGGGHTVPGFETSSLLYRTIAGPKNRDIDGPTEIWSFFLRQGEAAR